MLPPSSELGVELVIHMADIARREDAGFHTDTRSASTGALMIGTSADWFLRIVTGSVRRYSNRSPSSRACTLAPTSVELRAIASDTVSRRWAGAGGGRGSAMPPATPPTTPPATPACAICRRIMGAALGGSDFSSIIASCVCGVVCTLAGSGTTGRRA